MSHPALVRPASDEVPSSFADYVARVPENDVLAALAAQSATSLEVLRRIPESKADHRYAPEKWSIRELVGHLVDAERIVTYRALRFARGDTTPLPGFDEDEYVRQAPFATCRLADLADELDCVRRASLHFFRHLQPEAWLRRGTANGAVASVRGLAFAILGHERLHLETLRRRYLEEKD
jgi:hypothetical protein